MVLGLFWKMAVKQDYVSLRKGHFRNHECYTVFGKIAMLFRLDA